LLGAHEIIRVFRKGQVTGLGAVGGSKGIENNVAIA
jgi:hypothetical protein